MALTGRARVFADAVLGGVSNKQAAIQAGYSLATASAAGSRLVKDKRVVAYLAEKRDASAAPPSDVPPPPLDAPVTDDPKAFLLGVMANPLSEPRMRMDAAKALLPYLYPKLGEGGKKEQTQDAAKKVAGRFSAAAPPKLVAAGGKKV